MATKKTQEEPTPIYDYQGSKMEQLRQSWEQKWFGCKRCGLCQFRPNDDIVFGDGNPDSKVMIIGEAPGEEEEDCGVPFVGPSGKLLNQILAITSDDVGIQEMYRWYNRGRHTKEDTNYFNEKMLDWRRTEFFITNTIACRPPDNRQPTKPEIDACWERLYNLIYTVDPWFIITLGRPAIQTLMGKQIEVTKLRGTIFEVEIPGRKVTYKIPTMACFHPSYLLRQADWKSRTGSFMQTVRDFHAALTYVDGLKFHQAGIPLPSRLPIP